MNAGATSERIHETIRERVLSAQLHPGDRLDPASLAGPLASSTTPVREALCRLVGEGLVETRPGSGFHLPLLDEPELRDRIAWSRYLSLIALREASPEHLPQIAREPGRKAAPDRAEYYAHAIARRLEGLARASGNCEIVDTMARTNARLHAVRTGEPALFEDTAEELARLDAALREADTRRLARLLNTWHRRRERHAGQLVRLRYRTQ
ncbi:GntR family transcriptional regulator [Novosphingobium profundi]|uniref:GntR family transcriptional regulator n=1 Tax=Novosphingobium profundi TaxID=1774954 RepID=UPI001BDAF8C3|nr:GntR family transcriptional regulator [Novosphingobium profundi]MBT0670626.1 GntR family transcriptional regulator [Novosphingobium profundi]